MVRLFFVLSIMLVGLVACGDTGQSNEVVEVQSVDTEPTGRIVFQSNRNNSLNIYIMDVAAQALEML